MVENKKYTQWITLFDDPEDDEFDGDLEVDDEDLPRIHATFSITQVKRPERDQGSTGLDGKSPFQGSLQSYDALQKFCTNDFESRNFKRGFDHFTTPRCGNSKQLTNRREHARDD